MQMHLKRELKERRGGIRSIIPPRDASKKRIESRSVQPSPRYYYLMHLKRELKVIMALLAIIPESPS